MNKAIKFQLRGDGIDVSYVSRGQQEHARFTYKDAHHSHSFTGEEIRVVECDLGELVSVTIHMTTDRGSTTFSVLVPRTEVPGEQAIQIHSMGVTVVRRFSVIEKMNTGQLDTYQVVRLEGTASHALQT